MRRFYVINPSTSYPTDIFLTRGGKYRGSTRPTSCASQLLDSAMWRFERRGRPTQEWSWWWARYLGRGSNGTETLRRELEAENEGVRISSTIRWLCGVQGVKTRQGERTISALSVVQAFANEDTFRPVWKRGLLL